MKTLNIITLSILLGIATTPVLAVAQIKNAKTETVKIEGASTNCKNQIEKAANKNHESKLAWNAATKEALLTYNAEKTSKDEVLKRVALAGFDNEIYNAPIDVYQSLDKECQYKGEIKGNTHQNKVAQDHATMDHSTMDHEKSMDHSTASSSSTSKLESLYNHYFAIKDALIKGDTKTVSAKAKTLKSAITAVKMGELESKEHDVWMAVMKDLNTQVTILVSAKNLESQRLVFSSLSDTIYKLIKATDPAYTVYYSHCPMYNDGKGANWLSKEKAIQNPYYGSQMLTCGANKEIIK